MAHAVRVKGKVLSGGWFHLPVIFLWRWISISTEWMINEEIRDKEVRLIGADGSQLGVMSSAQALAIAEQQELDLVKIAPGSVPPVCRLMDYDKHRFEQSKREKEMRRNQKTMEIKEVQLSATIEENDIGVKLKNALRFLADGNKVKVSIRFRGRQIAHSEIGLKVMQDFAQRVQEVAVVERKPSIEGRNMLMILAPKTDKAAKGGSAAK